VNYLLTASEETSGGECVMCITLQISLIIGIKNKAVRTGIYEDVSKSFRTGHLERGLQMIQLSALGAVVSLFCESVG